MYKKFINAFNLLNVLLQALYSLAFPIGVGALASFLLVKYAYAPKWIWAVLLVIGTFCGLFSMIKFILSATANIDRIEKQRQQTEAERIEKEQRYHRLSAMAKNKNNEEGEQPTNENKKLD